MATSFRPARRPGLLARLVPVSSEAAGYRTGTALRDLMAALTVAGLAVPAAMGFAEVAGVSPVNGLYGLLLPVVAYALLGCSRQLVVGPEGTLAAMTGAVIVGPAVSGTDSPAAVAATLALLVAGCFALARLLRLGWLGDYLSRPVLVGYVHGIVVVLIAGQLGKLLGVDVAADTPVPQVVEAVREIGDAQPETLAVSAASLLVLFGLRRLTPRAPGPLVVVVGAIIASTALDLAAKGVATIGSVPSGLPPLGLPGIGVSDTIDLVPSAVGLFFVAFAETILLARAYAGRHSQHVDAGQELLALGAANAAAALSASIPVAGSTSRTAVADGSGVRTQVAGLMAAGVVALILIFLTGPIADLPKAALGATIVAAALRLVDVADWRGLARTDRVELAIAAVTAAGVIVTGVLPAIAFAIGLSIVDIVRRSARPHDAVLGWSPSLGRHADVATHRDAVQTPGVLVYRLDDRLFFANERYFRGRVAEALRGAPEPAHWLVLDAEGITYVDSAGMQALAELTRTLAAEGVTLVVARLRGFLRRRLDDAGVTDVIGAEHFHPTVQEAVDACTSRRAGAPV